jgi:hypothetical protein
MAIPEDRPLTVARVHQHYGKLIRRTCHGSCGRDVHAFLYEAVAGQDAEIITAETPQVAGAQAKPGARDEGGRDLATRHSGKSLEPLLAVAGGKLGDHGEQVDTVEPEADDIEGSAPTGWDGQREAHGPDASISNKDPD